MHEKSALLCCRQTGRAAQELGRCVGETTVVRTASPGAWAGIPVTVQETLLCLLLQSWGLAYADSLSPFTCILVATENLAGHKKTRLFYTERRILTELSDLGKHPCKKPMLLSDGSFLFPESVAPRFCWFTVPSNHMQAERKASCTGKACSFYHPFPIHHSLRL